MAYTTEQLISRIVDASRGIGFPESIALAQLARESANFRQDVVYGPFVGGAGEKGLAQFIPATWARFGSGNPYNPDDSLAAWQRYTEYLRGLFGDDYTKILQGYNGGEGNVQRNTVSSAAKRYAAEILAQAGNYQSASNTTYNTVDNSGFLGLDVKTWLLIGAVGLGAIFLLDD